MYKIINSNKIIFKEIAFRFYEILLVFINLQNIN